MHELICHAFQGIQGGIGARTATSLEDLFSEGWMDWIAIKMMDSAARSRGWPDGYLHSAMDFHRARRNHQNVGQSLKRMRVTIGRGIEAASQFYQFLLKIYREEAWSVFLRISLHLNLAAGTNDRRKAFTHNVFRSLMIDRGLPNEQARGRLARCVRNYLDSGDLEQILNFEV